MPVANTVRKIDPGAPRQYQRPIRHLLRAHLPAATSTQSEATIRSLIDVGRIPEARNLVAEADLAPPWAKIIAPPTVTVAETATGRNYDLPELGDELLEHAGKWVALGDRKVLDSDPSRKALRDRLRTKGLLGHAVFLKVEV